MTKSIWFKKLPQTEDSKTNAYFLRDLGVLNGEPVCEILYCGEKWIVRVSETLTQEQGLAEAARRIKATIDKHREPVQTKEALSRKCGISTGTLRKRLLFIQNHLPKEAATGV